MGCKHVFAFCGAMFTSIASFPAALPTPQTSSSSSTNIALVQSASVEGSGVSSLSQAFSTPNTAGNLIIAFARMSSTSQTIQVTDSLGNVYRDAVSQVQNDDGHQIHIFYAANVLSGANTVTSTFSAINNHPWLAIFEYSGVATSNPLDVTSSAQGTGTLASSGNTAPTGAANELVFAGMGLPSGSSVAMTAGTGFAVESQYTGTPGSRAGAEDEITTSAGSFAGTFSLNGTSNWTAVVATFSSAQLMITTSSLPQAVQGTPYNAALTATGGAPPYTWSMSGSLPPGLTFNSAGGISGTPTSSGSYSVVVQVTDAQGNTATQSLSIQVNSHDTNAIALVQSSRAAGSGVSSLSQAFSTPNSAGNLIIAFVRMSTSSQTVQVTDTLGNVYADAVSQVQSDDAHQTHIFYAANIAAGANTVTASFSGINNHPWLAIYEYSGLDPSTPLDQTAHSQGSTSSANSGATQATSSARELVFGGVGLPASTTQAVAADTGFTLLQQDLPPDTSRAANEQDIANSVAQYAASFTLSGTTNWTAVLATFQPPAPAHAQLVANPASIDFGSITAGASSTQSITVTNTGTASASITQLTETGAGFSADGLTVPYSLSPNASATIQVSFAPGSPGSYSGTLSLASDAPNSPLSVGLSGTGTQPPQAQIAASPSSVNFGNVNTGSSSSQMITLTNSGDASASISQVSIAAGGFSVSALVTPYTLAAGATVTLNVSFAPTTTTAYSGTLTVTSNASNPAVSVPLSGTGAQPPQGQLAATPTNVNFGNVNIGSTITQTVTLTNSGNANASISQVSESGSAFSLGGFTTPYTLAAGGTVTLSASFTPTATTSYSGTITLISDAANSQFVIPLSGSGTPAPQAQISANPGAVNFGATGGGSSAVQPVILANSGTAAASITQINATGTGFSVVGISLPYSLAAGASVSLQVVFSPALAGSYSGTATITSNAANSPTSIPLSGTATHSVGLSWTDGDSGIAGYNLYRASQSGGPYTKINSSLISPTTWNDTSVKPGQTYYYVITAVNASGLESPYSSEASAVIPTP